MNVYVNRARTGLYQKSIIEIYSVEEFTALKIGIDSIISKQNEFLDFYKSYVVDSEEEEKRRLENIKQIEEYLLLLNSMKFKFSIKEECRMQSYTIVKEA